MSFNTNITSHLSRLEAGVVYSLLAAFVICIAGYVFKFGGIL